MIRTEWTFGGIGRNFYFLFKLSKTERVVSPYFPSTKRELGFFLPFPCFWRLYAPAWSLLGSSYWPLKKTTQPLHRMGQVFLTGRRTCSWKKKKKTIHLNLLPAVFLGLFASCLSVFYDPLASHFSPISSSVCVFPRLSCLGLFW